MVYAATLLAGRYVLDEPIGAGGYCEVWRATDTVLTRQVAVKLLHAGYASQGEALARFKAEARHAGALSHENIARVYDYGEPADGQSYLVMELVDGPSLADVLARGPLGARPTMDTVAQVAAGLQAAHTAGLIHRDIKPANILFTSGGSVRITDFGIAHAVGSTPVTSTGMVMGTPGYIAPERVSGAQAGPASDLYALGVVAYECLAGSQPFAGGALDVAIAHRDRPLPPLPVSVPAEVAAFVMTLTAKDPAWRPASAGAAADQAGRLRDDLLSQGHNAQAVLSVVPAGPRSTVADDVHSRPRRRRPLAVAALTLAALTCLVLVSVTGFASGSHPAGSPSHTATATATGTGTASKPVPRRPRRHRRLRRDGGAVPSRRCVYAPAAGAGSGCTRPRGNTAIVSLKLAMACGDPSTRTRSAIPARASGRFARYSAQASLVVVMITWGWSLAPGATDHPSAVPRMV
jgi:serine/threonine-protein kinase